MGRFWRHRRIVVLFGLGVLACTSPRAAPVPRVASVGPEAPRVVAPLAPRVGLVLSIVIDQLPSWALERYLDRLSENGVLRRGIATGAFFPASRYAAATTLTAPGHATIYTGTTPNRHGVAANDVWSREAGKSLSVVDDRKSRVFGASGAFAAPEVLRAETVADALERATGGRAVTISLSLKDRAAVLPGGRKPDLALWFDWGKPGFTTSEYYSSEPPAWLAAWEDQHPLSARLEPWWPRDPATFERLLGPDDGAGEGDWLMLGRVFPHDPRRAKEPYSAFRATPSSSAYLLDLARECVRRFALGKHDTPDLLMISVSGTDYVGHVFGAESWEYLDNLQRVDEMLGRFVAEVESKVPVRVLVTSDHGVAALPEKSRARGHPAQRVSAESLRSELNRALRTHEGFGSEDLVESFAPPFVHLTPKARVESARAAIVQAVIAELERSPAVFRAFDVQGLLRQDASGKTGGAPPERNFASVLRAVELGIPADATGDVYVVMAQNSVIDPGMPRGAGTNHGSPWPYDVFVPVVFFGPGVDRHAERSPVEQSRVAATLARLLEISPPKDADPRALPGLSRIVVRYR